MQADVIATQSRELRAAYEYDTSSVNGWLSLLNQDSNLALDSKCKLRFRHLPHMFVASENFFKAFFSVVVGGSKSHKDAIAAATSTVNALSKFNSETFIIEYKQYQT